MRFYKCRETEWSREGWWKIWQGILCTDLCILCKKEGKKVGGLEKRRETKQPGRWGRNGERCEREKGKGRWLSWWISKECSDDVTMQLIPPAPAHGDASNPHEGDYLSIYLSHTYTHSFTQETLKHDLTLYNVWKRFLTTVTHWLLRSLKTLRTNLTLNQMSYLLILKDLRGDALVGPCVCLSFT